MRRTNFFLLLALSFLPAQAFAQQTASAPVRRDPQAVSLVQSALAAMGEPVPNDSVATGSLTVVAGSQASSGTIRILTRGTDQTSELITLPQSTYAITFSRGAASETRNAATSSLSLERSVTSQSPCFPLAFLTGALANQDEAVQYVGRETLEQTPVQHIRIWNTFFSQPKIQRITELTTTDIWLDATTGLPQKISFVQRDGGGASPRIRMELFFSNYSRVGGFAYPFQVHKSLNGTPWMTITISSVSFNTGLTDTSFPVQ